MTGVIIDFKNRIETKKIIERELPKICDYLKDIASESYIREQAIKNIRSIRYEKLNDGLLGNYSYENKDILLDINSDEETLIHEMLHAITNRSNTSRGFKRINRQENKTIKGEGLDEAITEELAQNITKKEGKELEKIERYSYTIFKTCIGEESFLKDYVLGTDTVEKEIKRQYNDNVLKEYQNANYYLDAYTIGTTFLAHQKSDDKDFEINFQKAKKIIELSINTLPKHIENFAKECLSIKKNENERTNKDDELDR